MPAQQPVVVAGASAAGLTTVEVLRREGFDGPIILVGDENIPPYDRPPLSKQFMAGQWEAERTYLRSPEALAALDARWLLGVRAEGLDVTARRIALSNGDHLGYDKLVIATGVSPRALPGTAGLHGVHQLKSLPDAVALRAALAARPRVVVIGAGPLGAEFAATARQYADDITLVDSAATPLHRQLGPLVGGLIGSLHRDHGVRLRLGAGVTGIRADRGRVVGVRLTDGDVLDADLVLVAIGSVPNTGWLEHSGLRLNDGVVCDSTCRAGEDIFAAGDVARWHHPGYGRSIRIEHRMNATEQGMAVARNLLGPGRDFAPVPYFWTDHYDTTIQLRGTCRPASDFVVVDGDVGSRRFVGLYGAGGRVTAVLSWNSVREARSLHHLLASPHDWTETIARLART